ncbi:MAG: PaaX family transcriptional regulator C-terminal domain-containing protein [Nocardioidaceae bacterium]|nr:PaaX family transcriptional regulator C-terminal domain-containing protein [Nocardioidaceae bacterium]
MSDDRAGLDDVDSRPGSVTSLVRTVLGTHLRDLGGWVAVADLVRLLEALDVPADSTRVAVGRLKTRGVLVAEPRDGRSGYALSGRAASMLERGDTRIFGPGAGPDDGWLLVSFSIPEDRRGDRHQLRRQLAWAGCGTVSSGLWVAPAHRASDVDAVVDGLGLRDHVTTFACREVGTPVPLVDVVRRWWDLDAVAARHLAFLDAHADSPEPSDGRASFVHLARLVDAWRTIPSLDPGLPPHLLPPDWPGTRSLALVATARAHHLPPARAWVRDLVRPSRPTIPR